MEFFDKIDIHNPGESLRNAVKWLEKISGFVITIHDHRGLLFSKSGEPFLAGKEHHSHLYCEQGRYSELNWNSQCMRNCARTVESIALKELKPFIHSCWKGVEELIVPVVKDDALLLIIYAGVFKSKEVWPTADVLACMKSEYRKLKYADHGQLEKYAALLQIFGQGMLDYAFLYHKEADEKHGRKEIIRKYVYDNVHRDITLAGLAKRLSISGSRARHLVSSLFGNSFQELIMQERMHRSRNLLIYSEQDLKEIANSIGIPNVYYFNRCFKNFFGVPPGTFRRNMKSNQYKETS